MNIAFVESQMEDPIHHIRKFNERFKVLKLNHANNEIIKVKLFPIHFLEKH
jgi:hypothetical protein